MAFARCCSVTPRTNRLVRSSGRHREPNTAAPRISRYERGLSEPNLEVVRQLAKALDLPEAYFFATSDVLAKAILVIASLPVKGQAKKSFAPARLPSTLRLLHVSDPT
ncbi:helix-turn-helix domain-containing protein [Lysobacter capsici]|uniref:helix-turn-helix domain-containing protein n=1 Tax=Lysobacter capsici TaxID=435897 RepID=UPI002079963F|nr:helix-turn-helix transcriptional regulator [Lysobacter capsici]